MKSNGRKISKKRILLSALNVLAVILALACALAALHLTGILDAQKAAERWRGENELKFSQVSCYLPVDGKLELGQIYEFRQKMTESFHAAALDIDNDSKLFVDAWSTTGKLSAISALGKGEVSVIAVGGQFFNFHPLRLLSGSYISEDDLMKDRVLLDPESAWLLFGGTDLQGMELRLNGRPFLVAGVVDREEDFASRRAYTAGMGIYMSYEALKELDESAGITCYELVSAEPVKGFAANMVKTNFPIGAGELVENSRRYSVSSLFKVLGNFGKRSMQTLGVVYPYWENAARLMEDWSAVLALLCVLFALLPACTGAVLLVKGLRRGKAKLSHEVLPKIKDSAEEAIRVRQRRRWEKKQGRHEK